jgi:MFS family permease
MAGSAMAQIALVFAVRDVTESITTLGVVVAARSIANVVFLLWGGVVADRLPRQYVLVGSSAVSMASQALLAVLVLTGTVSIPAFVVLAAVNGMSSAFSFPASAALVPQTVPAELRQRANALLRLGLNSSMIAGASLGGLLIAFAGPGWGLVVDALSFGLAALAFSFVRVPAARVAAEHKPGMLSELRLGWTEFVSRTWVWVVVVAFFFVNAAHAGGTMVLGPVIADTVIGRETWGLVLAAQTTGMVAGAFVAMRIRVRRLLLLGVVCTAGFAGLPLALALHPAPWLLMVTGFVCGVCMEQFGVAWETSLQHHVPADRLARVYSYDMLGSIAAIPLAQLVVGPVSGAAGITAALLGCAVIHVVATAAMVASRSVRSVENAPVVQSAR